MSDDERARAERALRLALAVEARREREARETIRRWFYAGIAVLVTLFLAAMLFT